LRSSNSLLQSLPKEEIRNEIRDMALLLAKELSHASKKELRN